MLIQFPSSFLWGAALSSYQTEGGNYNSDWCLWEKEKGWEQAGKACGHYHLFESDFELACRLNFSSLRISIEWARVCPERGYILSREIEHYKQVVDGLVSRRLKPVVTLHHFTNPVWFNRGQGWLSSKNIDSFLYYLKETAAALKDKVDLWLIFNEPLVYIYNSFLCGIWPPGKKSLSEGIKVLKNIISAYTAGYQEIKRIYKGSNVNPGVSLAKHFRSFDACPRFNFGLNSLSAFFRNRVFNFSLIDHLCRKKVLDYLAVNYYCKEYVRFNGGLPGAECVCDFHQERRNDLGWYVYPQGFYDLLMKLKKFNLPVIVTENGTAEKENVFYENYLVSHLRGLAKALNDGVDIRGYLWWSLLDNFEWDKGFNRRFGLVEVDYRNLQRKIRPFAYTYAKICRENKIEI